MAAPTKRSPAGLEEFIWRAPDGAPLSCYEKLKILNENIEEIRSMCEEALEDAVLMGCDEDQVRQVLHQLVDSLDATFKD